MGKKSSAPAPAPDPMIGQSAMMQAQMGKEWLAFSQKQFDAGEIRQDKMDALTGQVAESALASQAQADKWAGEDRQIQADYRNKYDGWANEDRALGRKTMADLDKMGADAMAKANGYEQQFGAEAANQYAFGGEERDRYRTLFRPVQDRMVSDAMTWDSPERMEAEAAKAKADVVGNAAQQQQANQRSMASMGINPNSGRFAGVDRATSAGTALAAAGAQNMSRDAVRAQGIQLRGQAGQVGQQVVANGQQATSLGMQGGQLAHTAGMTGINTKMQAKNMGLAAAGVGNTAASLGMGNQGAGYAGLSTGLSAGGAAVGAQQAGNNGFTQNNGIMTNGFSGAMQGYAGQGGTLNNLYGNQIQGYQAQQAANGAAAGGIGSMIGSLAGAGTAIFL